MRPVAVGAVVMATLCAARAGAQAPRALTERYDFEQRASRFDLPGRLAEVSGLAVTPDGRLFAHDDERGVVYEIDPREERVSKSFSLGEPAVTGDFEGIAVVGERFFLVTSHGLLYEFREMADGRPAPYRLTDTELGAVCEIEGLDYDPEDEALLFACKVSAPERGSIVIHRIALDPGRGRLSPLLVPRGQLATFDVDADFAPSAVAVDPWGTLLLLSASREALIEIDRSGKALAGIRLSSGRHRQPEGLALAPDGTLYIADEGDGRRARVTAYGRVR